MPALSSYDYAIVRVVPRVERAECLNAGVILFCRTRRFLAAQVWLDELRLAALAPDLELPTLRQHLGYIPRVAAGGPGGGPIGALPQADRFHWLTAPRSTSIQVSPVHSGVCHDPAVALERLVARYRERSTESEEPSTKS